MYTILTTCPDYGSRNVGDKLIEVRTKEMITREKGDDEFFTIFREEPLEPHLDEVNRSKAVIMPLAVRDPPMYPGTYRLTEDLSAIKVPLIPIGACWNVYPRDSKSRERVEYSKAKDDMFAHTDTKISPWFVVNADDKRRARLNCIAHLLSMIPYEEVKKEKVDLPPINKKGYVRPPITEQTFDPEVF